MEEEILQELYLGTALSCPEREEGSLTVCGMVAATDLPSSGL